MDSKPIVWPDPPEPARIAFVQSVHRPADIGIKMSAFSRFGHWLTGSDKGNEPLSKPFGIALDEQDNLCLTDTGASVVCYYDKMKKKWSRWDKVGNFRFASPVAIAKRDGVFFVADSVRSCVVAFDQTGKLAFLATNHLERPSGLAILKDQIFVSDSQRHRVVIFDLRGGYRSEFGRRGVAPGEFNFPTHLSVDQQANLYVTDSMNCRVQILDENGNFKGKLGSIGDSPGHFGRPKGVAVDGFGHIYAMDALFDNLQVFDQAGRLLLNLGSSGSQPGEFWLPNGVAISRSNEIFTTDSYNHRIQIFKYVGPS
jgi:sugar lactone lactonase YvrE